MPPDTLTAAAVAAALGPLSCRYDVTVLEQCDSTNARLLELAEAGAPSGSVIAAREQRAGRGRRGRSWHSAAGDSLTFSLLWRFAAGTRVDGLSLAVGVGLARALEASGAAGVGLKWPNDILAGGRKLAGVLIELVPGQPAAAVIGVGINVRPPATMPPKLRAQAAALSELGVAAAGGESLSVLLAAILRELCPILDGFAAAGFSAVRDEWQRRHVHAGRMVRLLAEFAAPLQGRCLGVAADGALLLGTDGGVERIISGDISLRGGEDEQAQPPAATASGRRLICLDCGNSRLKWGVWQEGGQGEHGGTWLEQGALPVAEIAALAGALGRAASGATRAIACNVAARSAREAIEQAAAALALPLQWVESRRSQCGVTNGYEDPAQLGADRWAALIGARHLHGASCLVVGAGTATTIDVLDNSGLFQGGLILPGIELMRQALAANTARLPASGGRFTDLPQNSLDAIATGCLLATAGAIRRMFARIAGDPGAVCLLSGGAAESLKPALDIPCRRIDNLVLEGLARIGATEEQEAGSCRQ